MPGAGGGGGGHFQWRLYLMRENNKRGKRGSLCFSVVGAESADRE